MNVMYPSDLGFRKMEFNFKGYTIEKIQDGAGQLSYSLTNSAAVKNESYSPTELQIFPRMMISKKRL